MDGRRQPAPSAILNVSTTRDLEGYADVTLRVVDKNVTFQVPVDWVVGAFYSEHGVITASHC